MPSLGWPLSMRIRMGQVQAPTFGNRTEPDTGRWVEVVPRDWVVRLDASTEVDLGTPVRWSALAAQERLTAGPSSNPS